MDVANVDDTDHEIVRNNFKRKLSHNFTYGKYKDKL